MITIKKLQKPMCPQCDRLKNTIENIEQEIRELAGDHKFEVIDITKEPEAIGVYHVMSTPVLIFERDGEEKIRLTGDRPAHEILSAITFTKGAR